jgi:hypothetical protein
MPMSTWLVLGIVLAGCGGGGDGRQCHVTEPSLQDINAKIFTPSCGNFTGCHYDDDKSEPRFVGFDGRVVPLILQRPDDLCDAIDRPAVSDEQHRPLITCGSCADSYMMIKVDPARSSEITTSTELAARTDGGAIEAGTMPEKHGQVGVPDDPLCEGELQALCAWIDAGCSGCQ